MVNVLVVLFVFALLAVGSQRDVVNMLFKKGHVAALPPSESPRPLFLDFGYTDTLRGLAILLVLVCHVSSTMGTVLFTPLGGTGVALFLFLSGYGLNES